MTSGHLSDQWRSSICRRHSREYLLLIPHDYLQIELSYGIIAYSSLLEWPLDQWLAIDTIICNILISPNRSELNDVGLKFLWCLGAERNACSLSDHLIFGMTIEWPMTTKFLKSFFLCIDWHLCEVSTTKESWITLICLCIGFAIFLLGIIPKKALIFDFWQVPGFILEILFKVRSWNLYHKICMVRTSYMTP